MKHNILTLLILAAISTGCGGSDSGTSARIVSGTWSGSLTKVADACAQPSISTLSFTHQVSQNESAITLVAESGFQFLGNIVGDNGFSVDATHATIGQPSCQDTTQIRYDSIDADNDTTGAVTIDISRSCASSPCAISFTGTASRISFSPGVQPTPATTQTPGALASGGCLAVNTHPAAGSYSGDGNCGISTAEYSTSGQAVILNPFGANGAASFNVSAANSSSASSVGTNLIIKGEAGYACSLTCSPPATFTLQCFKEGGVICTEKF